MRIEDFPTTEDLDSCDWEEILGRNDGDGHSPNYYGPRDRPPQHAVSAVLGDGTVPRPEAEDVVQVIAFDAKSPGRESVCHELDFVALLELTGGRQAIVEAWTDCTGWGCQDGVRWIVGSPEQVETWLTDGQRQRLGLA